MLRRALTAAVPVTLAGVLQLTLGATVASAAVPGGAHATQPSILAGVLRLLAPQHAATPAAMPGPAAAAQAAPAGSARAHGLTLGLLGGCVSCTSASATPGHGAASATGLRLLGNDLSAGSSSGHGTQSGSLLALPSNPLLALVFAGWTAGSDSGATAASGDARSALTDLSLAGDLARLSLLRSTSHAGVAGASGSGGAATDGAAISLLGGALDLNLLHSDTDASGTAHSYLASVNGTPVGALSSSGAIPVTIPGVLDLALLQADSAAANGGTGSAAIGSVSGVLGTPGIAAGVLGSSSTGSTGGGTPASGGAVAAAPSTPAGPPPSGLGVMPNPRTIPQTGSFIGLAGLGLVITGSGLAAASTARRRGRRPAAV
jgi:hypothetical protein